MYISHYMFYARFYDSHTNVSVKQKLSQEKSAFFANEILL